MVSYCKVFIVIAPYSVSGSNLIYCCVETETDKYKSGTLIFHQYYCWKNSGFLIFAVVRIYVDKTNFLPIIYFMFDGHKLFWKYRRMILVSTYFYRYCEKWIQSNIAEFYLKKFILLWKYVIRYAREFSYLFEAVVYNGRVISSNYYSLWRYHFSIVFSRFFHFKSSELCFIDLLVSGNYLT